LQKILLRIRKRRKSDEKAVSQHKKVTISPFESDKIGLKGGNQFKWGKKNVSGNGLN
jgi:hypothetical protein